MLVRNEKRTKQYLWNVWKIAKPRKTDTRNKVTRLHAREKYGIVAQLPPNFGHMRNTEHQTDKKSEGGIFNMVERRNIQLAAFQDEDVTLFTQWLGKDYFYKWFCCDGEDSRQARTNGLAVKQAWLDQITSRKENPHRQLFIVTFRGSKIGFGACIDLAGEPEYVKEKYPDLAEKLTTQEAFELNYGIGEAVYLNQGIGKIIIRRLEETCRGFGATWLLADPSEQNTPSVKVLLSNGFEQYKDGDYRKQVSRRSE